MNGLAICQRLQPPNGDPMQYRALATDEISLARALLESCALEDQIHHFLHVVTSSELDLWEERAHGLSADRLFRR